MAHGANAKTSLLVVSVALLVVRRTNNRRLWVRSALTLCVSQLTGNHQG